LQECALVKQHIDAEWEILTLQRVQSWLLNSAIGIEFLTLLTVEEGPAERSEQGQISHARRLQATKNVIFAALAGNAEAIKYVEARTGRSVGMGPETPAQFAPATPMHIFTDRAITTRIARRDSAYRDLTRRKTERAARVPSHYVAVEDIRSQLEISDYIKLLVEVDLMQQAEPDLYGQQLLQVLNEKSGAAAKTAPLTPGQELLQGLERSKSAAECTARPPVSVHVRGETTGAPPSPDCS